FEPDLYRAVRARHLGGAAHDDSSPEPCGFSSVYAGRQKALRSRRTLLSQGQSDRMGNAEPGFGFIARFRKIAHVQILRLDRDLDHVDFLKRAYTLAQTQRRLDRGMGSEAGGVMLENDPAHLKAFGLGKSSRRRAPLSKHLAEAAGTLDKIDTAIDAPAGKPGSQQAVGCGT